MTREFFTSGKDGCYDIPNDFYLANEAIFFKLIHSNIYNNKQEKEKVNLNLNLKVTSLEDFGITPLPFTEIMDNVFANRPKDYLKDFFENDVI